MENLLGELCILACKLSHALRASISYRDVLAGKIKVICRSNGGPSDHLIRHAIPKVGPKCPVFLVPDIFAEPTFEHYDAGETFPNLRALAAYWLGTINGHDHFLIIWNPPTSFFESKDEQLSIDHIVSIMCQTLKSTEVKLERLNLSPNTNQRKTKFLDLPGGAATRFLVDTLVPKQRLLGRNGASYVALRQWRKNIKPYQISALAALKTCSDNCFEDEIASEMAEAIKRVYGNAFSYVVPVPGGSSGANKSLSVKLATRVAKLLDAEFANVLVAAQVPRGSSHPAKSASLKPYKVNGIIKGNVLIIDDVATSGKHIEFATNAIRPLSTFCTSAVWIAS